MSLGYPRVPGESETCLAVREVLNRVGDKWSILVVTLLREGPKRFSELKRTIEGISQRMLTLTLRGLERDGLVTRSVFPIVPPRVDYALTPLGKTLLEPVNALAAWAERHRAEIQEARRRFDVERVPPKSRGTAETTSPA
ncbi:MAG TPA: helix-turn-helix domain-containing protein [Polyangiaceae bacterium]|nr:helix-turn-helix domain-containing protein [Polyangiaceae bacterium]